MQLRVSGMISNSSYILTLDCDMYCNDPTSARQAMCFHLDPILSPNLAYVQFPQRFHNINSDDIYDGALRFIWVSLLADEYSIRLTHKELADSFKRDNK